MSLFLLSLGLLILNLAVSTVRQLYFIQLKEYRYDRLVDFIRYDKGKRQMFRIPNVIIYIALLINLFVFSQAVLYFNLGFLLIINLTYALKEGVYRFKRTKKALLIFGLYTLVIAAGLITFPTIWGINLTYIISPLVLLTIVGAFMPITKMAKEKVISKATEKVKKHENLKVIGITGSYGKTSTKEFLYEILKTKFNVLKTPENINTDIGVARIILKDLKPEHEIAIVEMGAYKIGEIANICKITPPNISILTAIASQHLSLFGSLENIKKAKSEILENLQFEGTAIVNGDSLGCREILEEKNYKAITYGSEIENVSAHIENIKQEGEYLEFEVEGTKYKANLLGTHMASNLTAAILAAKKLGLSEEEIKTAIKSIKPESSSLTIKEGYNGSVIIDDSYNSNPKGFIAAIHTAANKKVDGKKILLTMGMVELGKETEKQHKLVGEVANKYFDHIIVTRRESYKPFKKVIPETKLKLAEHPIEIIEHLKETVEKHDLILVENRQSKKVIEFLIKE